MKLDTKDIQSITDSLLNFGVHDRDLREEMVDHYCAEVESHISLGIEKSLALAYVLKQINPVILKEMNRTVKKEKFKTKLPMIGIISLIAFLCVSPFFIKPEHPNHSNAEIVPGFDFQLSDPPYLWPINTQPTGITSHFGSRLNPFTKKLQQHRGIDIKAKLGTKIMSPSDATVLEVGYNKKDGHFIILQHDDVYKTRFCHLSKTAVETGIQVKAGEAIGEVGNSGMSTKPHLHYEVMKNGLHVDPIDYLKT